MLNSSELSSEACPLNTAHVLQETDMRTFKQRKGMFVHDHMHGMVK